MNVRFCIEYYAAEGQSLHIVFSKKSYAMQLGGNGIWSIALELKSAATYHYELRDCNGETLRKEPTLHKIARLTHDITVYDRWWDTPIEQPFYSSFFTDVVLRRRVGNWKMLKPAERSILLEVDAPTLLQDERLAIVGGSAVLGGWNVEQAVQMNDATAPTWKILLPLEAMGSEYKFIITDLEGNFKRYEGGNNRIIPFLDSQSAIIRGLRWRTSDEDMWRGAGVAIPVFSLRSEKSWGVGEFSDLKLMADWAKRTGMSIIQILPVNDTSSSFTWHDSYPYNAISSFALHPLYLGAEAAIKRCRLGADDSTIKEMKELLEKYSSQGAKLNAKSAVDYDKSIKLKIKFLKELYKLCGKQVMASKLFLEFMVESEEWLLPYATYCTLRDKYNTTDFSQWEELASYTKDAAYDYALRKEKEIGFYCFVQYLLDAELREVRNYAHTLGVALKGDIPIGVSPCSVDVWCAPELYNNSMSAGAPPDAFAEDGQNWGFPTYNWAKMAEDGYDWWRRRLQKMARYFDAYRIDHILGFFRIWETPRQAVSAIVGHFYPSKPYSAEDIAEAGLKKDIKQYCGTEPFEPNTLFVAYPEGGYTPRIEGYKTEMFKALTQQEQEAFMHLHEEFFFQRHNDFWRECALKRLPALMASTRMLTCGEDLGMIPACVPDVMKEQGILSLEIERMPKQLGVAFGNTASYPYYSVTATSTHDMSNIRSWWEEDAELTQHYWSDILHHGGIAQKGCSADTARQIIERQMRSNSILAILPLQDWLATDDALRQKDPASERINIPANPQHYWRFRMHLTLEQLLDEKEFNKSISQLVALR
ncbi:MAG: 4-alpha-glucanotransferase [Alistipes sp.]|nr:4-alpha-glucanotransferase [Alistipes sp.]